MPPLGSKISKANLDGGVGGRNVSLSMLLRPSLIKLGKDAWLEEGLMRAGGVVGGDGGLEGRSLLMVLV